MDPKQLELFQPIGDHESLIFGEAKKSKDIAQTLYNGLNFVLPSPKDLLNNTFLVLRLNVLIDLATDNDFGMEPNTPRVFIWHFTPILSILLNDEEINLNDKFDKLLEPKVIKSWINTLYTAGSFSQSEFHSIASQYFALEVLSNILHDSSFISYIENKADNKSVIIYFENRLFPSKAINIVSFMESDMMKKVFNYFKSLEMIQKNNWYFIGSYETFSDKNSLLKGLDGHNKIKTLRKANSSTGGELTTLNEIFQNDFLFLNNYAFIDKKHNTHGWNENIIIPPNLLNDEFTQIDKKKLFNVTRNNEIEARQLFIYFKKMVDSNFLRTDILLPNIDLKNERLLELLSLLHELKK